MDDLLIHEYAEECTNLENQLLDDLERYTQTNMLQSRMLSGKIQGRLLAFISKLRQPKHILEIGTFSGYSALCLAEGLESNGLLYTIDINDELADVHEKYILKSQYSKQINIQYGDALDLVPKIHSKWDLVFIDADKMNYINYYNMVLPNMNKGGVIIADNVLWSGKVLDNMERLNDRDTKALHDFNVLVRNDSRVENFLLPVRDGLMILRVK
ncbi:MAG: O-methyltransferase [Bacteroidia bacterium]|nr:O-methyltransferase [Bacteroidia bacterium]